MHIKYINNNLVNSCLSQVYKNHTKELGINKNNNRKTMRRRAIKKERNKQNKTNKMKMRL